MRLRPRRLVRALRSLSFMQRRILRRLSIALTSAVALALGGSALSAETPALPLRVVARVSLPEPSNRFDYTSVDQTANRLYIAHMDAGRLLVFDVKRRRVLKTIAAPGVHGVIAVPRIHRV